MFIIDDLIGCLADRASQKGKMSQGPSTNIVFIHRAQKEMLCYCG